MDKAAQVVLEAVKLVPGGWTCNCSKALGVTYHLLRSSLEQVQGPLIASASCYSSTSSTSRALAAGVSSSISILEIGSLSLGTVADRSANVTGPKGAASSYADKHTPVSEHLSRGPQAQLNNLQSLEARALGLSAAHDVLYMQRILLNDAHS